MSLGLLQTERHSIFSVKEIIRLSNFILLGPIHIQKYHSVGIFFGLRYTILGWYISKIQIDNWSCWKVGHNPVVYHNDSNEYWFLQDNPVKYLIKPPEHFLYHRIETNMVWYFLCYIYIIFLAAIIYVLKWSDIHVIIWILNALTKIMKIITRIQQIIVRRSNQTKHAIGHLFKLRYCFCSHCVKERTRSDTWSHDRQICYVFFWSRNGGR